MQINLMITFDYRASVNLDYKENRNNSVLSEL